VKRACGWLSPHIGCDFAHGRHCDFEHFWVVSGRATIQPEIQEIVMRDTEHGVQVFTPPSRGLIPEGDGHNLWLERGKGSGWWQMTLIALLLCVTTTAAAVMAAGRTHSPIPALWKQGPPSIFTKAPDGAEYRELLF